MSLRILLVSDVYPPLIGGVERQLQQFGRLLTDRGYAVRVVTTWQSGLPEEAEERGVIVNRLKGLSKHIPRSAGSPRYHHPPFPDPFVVARLRRIIREWRPDVLHVYGWIAYSCALALVGSRVPLLLSVREYASTCALRTLLYKGQTLCSGAALGKCLTCAVSYYGPAKGVVGALAVLSGRPLLRWKSAGIHSISQYMQAYVRRELFGGQSMGDRLDVIIPSFRDDAAPTEIDISPYLQQLPTEPFILFVGALRLVKGLGPLLAAYERLERRPRLVLIGRQATDTPVTFPSSVTVCYDFPHAAVMAAWRRALFGVAPSLWPEPFGNVVHEAMSQGKAVIGTVPGGHSDMIISGETGLLVPAGDVDALTRAMQHLIDAPEVCAQMGRAGSERAHRFSADAVVPQFERLYADLVARSRGAVFEGHA